MIKISKNKTASVVMGGYLCGVENVNYPAEDRAAFTLMFLADELNVP